MSSPAADAADAVQTAFRERDFTVVADRLAGDVVFNSPVLERPWTGKAVVEQLGPAMVTLFDDVEFAPVVVDGGRAIVSFDARRDDVAVQAVEVVEADGSGRITEMTVYIRPLAALVAVARGMESALDPELLARHLT